MTKLWLGVAALVTLLFVYVPSTLLSVLNYCKIHCHSAVNSVRPSIHKACRPNKPSVQNFIWCVNREVPKALMWPQSPPKVWPLNFAWGEHCKIQLSPPLKNWTPYNSSSQRQYCITVNSMPTTTFTQNNIVQLYTYCYNAKLLCQDIFITLPR